MEMSVLQGDGDGHKPIPATENMLRGAPTGTAGTPSSNVQSVQGVSGGTPLRTGSVETTNTPAQVVLVAATANTLAAANANRIRFTIYNPTQAALYVRKAAVDASLTVFDFVVPAGGSYFSDPFEWAGEMRGFSTPGGTINVSQSV